METHFARILWFFLGASLTLNVVFTAWTNLKTWADDPDPFPVVEESLEPDALDAELEIFTQVERKYLLKCRSLVQTSRKQGETLLKMAPAWWDRYHSLLERIDAVSKKTKADVKKEDKEKLARELRNLENQFRRHSSKVDAGIQRFFAALEVARLLTTNPPASMSAEGKALLAIQSAKLQAIETNVRIDLRGHHLIEDPDDRRNGWSCAGVISSLLNQTQLRLQAQPAAAVQQAIQPAQPVQQQLPKQN